MKKAFISRISCVLFALVTVMIASNQKIFAASESSVSRKPNVILILTDDQGSVDVNCYGSKDLYTPNMDKLAQQGVRFSQFYVGAPICSPSRAALLTGRYPQRAQLTGNAYGDRGMPASQLTIAELLQGDGYKTAIFGKWHIGDNMEMSPNAQGFDQFLGHKVGCIDNYSHFFYWVDPNRHDLWKNQQEYYEDGKFFPDIIVREAGKFMEENKDNPFFMYLPFNLPHYPLQAQEKYREMYKDVKDPKRRRYGAFVSTLDEKVGQVVDKLEELELRDNTIIIFLSDHGHSEESRTFGGGGSAGPYRGHKFELWEGGIRVPCIISWPGNIPSNEVRDELATSIDLFPTIARYCGVDLPSRKLDGMDITDIIESDQAVSKRDAMHWQSGGMWSVRQGQWKLVSDHNKLFLSDMAKDVTETNNIAGEYPEIVKKLTRLHDIWVEEVKVQ